MQDPKAEEEGELAVVSHSRSSHLVDQASEISEWESSHSRYFKATFSKSKGEFEKEHTELFHAHVFFQCNYKH